jgi:hypothetical protein
MRWPGWCRRGLSASCCAAPTCWTRWASTNLKVQMDLYHCQIVEGNVDTKLRQFEFDSSSSSALHRFASGLESLPLN